MYRKLLFGLLCLFHVMIMETAGLHYFIGFEKKQAGGLYIQDFDQVDFEEPSKRDCIEQHWKNIMDSLDAKKIPSKAKVLDILSRMSSREASSCSFSFLKKSLNENLFDEIGWHEYYSSMGWKLVHTLEQEDAVKFFEEEVFANKNVAQSIGWERDQRGLALMGYINTDSSKKVIQHFFEDKSIQGLDLAYGNVEYALLYYLSPVDRNIVWPVILKKLFEGSSIKTLQAFNEDSDRIFSLSDSEEDV